MLVSELRRLLSGAPDASSVLVFVRRLGALEPEVAELAEVHDVPTEEVVVLYVDIASDR
jgi:hypothetical protein